MLRLIRLSSLFAATVLLSTCISSVLAENILLVGEPEGNNDDGDVVLHLEGLGHQVTQLLGDDSTTQDGLDHDAIIISSSLGSGTVRGKFQNLEVPIMFWEAGLTRWDHNDPDGNFRMSEYSRDGTGGETSFIEIRESAVGHPLAADLPAGEHEIFTGAFRTPVLYGELAPGLLPIASLDSLSIPFVDLRNQVDDPFEASHWVDENGAQQFGPPIVYAAMEKGGQLGPASDGLGGAPERRVHFPVHDRGFASLNDNGLALFESAIAWLLEGSGPTAGITGDYNGNGQVEQGDLDLVLLNWGADGTSPPAGWENDLPAGSIDQNELDGVLLNWGTTAAAASANAVPEPTTAALGFILLATLVIMCPLRRKASHARITYS